MLKMQADLSSTTSVIEHVNMAVEKIQEANVSACAPVSLLPTIPADLPLQRGLRPADRSFIWYYPSISSVQREGVCAQCLLFQCTPRGGMNPAGAGWG